MPQTVLSPFVMVIFGATGDLTARKLMPALYNLLADGILPEKFLVVGFARRDMTYDEFRALMKEAVIKHSRIKEQNLQVLEKLMRNIYYQKGFFEEDAPYHKLIDLLATFDKEIGACITRFFYLATPPQNYSTILSKLATTKLSEGCGQGSSKWTRVLIEKPFGKDLEQSKKLEEQLCETFEERQIYRIDHYLAKETIQNIMAFRFANPIENLWNRDYIDHVQITIAESNGVGSRGKFYEGVGALRDVAQNHLMAMLAYTTMEEPEELAASSIRNRRVEVLEKIRRIDEYGGIKNVVRGQYGKESEKLKVKSEKFIRGYREEVNVDPMSMTETFVAFKLFIENDRWKDVPFYLRTGKRIAESSARISVYLKNRVSKLFSSFDMGEGANVISIRIQPREGISLRFFAKQPGLDFALQSVKMQFTYEHEFRKDIMDSYEKILVDSMTGDQTLFATSEGFAATWEFITGIISAWERQAPPVFPNYAGGTWGPKEADELIERDGRKWLLR